MDFVYNLFLFPMTKKFENQLGFDKVITITWVVHFFGTQCMYVCVQDLLERSSCQSQQTKNSLSYRLPVTLPSRLAHRQCDVIL